MPVILSFSNQITKTSFQTSVISETLKTREIVNLTSNQIGIFGNPEIPKNGWECGLGKRRMNWIG